MAACPTCQHGASGQAMTADDPMPCAACGEREALPGAFACAVCCPAPEPDREPEAWQPELLAVPVRGW